MPVTWCPDGCHEGFYIGCHIKPTIRTEPDSPACNVKEVSVTCLANPLQPKILIRSPTRLISAFTNS